MFLGANIDAVETAKSIGIRRERAAWWKQSHKGVEECYDEVSYFCSLIRENRDFDSSDMQIKKKKGGQK
jgi:hypothetical protein